MSRSRRAWIVAAALAAAAVGVSATPAPAMAAPSPVGPNQYFVGAVNGRTINATIAVGCAGPIYPGRTGHPLAGQTVEVRRVAITPGASVGYTGSAANEIGAQFGPSSNVAPVRLRSYEAPMPIPTTLLLPCAGTGVVTFVPTPTSATARPATVSVTYVGLP